MTTPPQTLFDLLGKPHQGKAPQAAMEAVRNLRAQVTAAELRAIAENAQRVPATVKQAIAEMEQV